MRSNDLPASKKKFGKNLNKLVKPAAPPIVDRSSGSSRNGLLLLSTKNNNKSVGGGMLASKSNNGPTSSTSSVTATAPGLTKSSTPYDSKTASTHDALISAVVGASQADNPVQPDAWGVSASAAAAASAASENQGDPIELENSAELHFAENDPAAPSPEHSQRNDHGEPPPIDLPKSSMNWDEYGGRGDSSQGKLVGDDEDQGVIMARLARERAQKRRAEEEARFAEQRQKAAQRLQELDQKVALQQQESGVAMAPKRQPWDTTRQTPRTLWEPDKADGQSREPERKNGTRDSQLASGTNVSASVESSEDSKADAPVIHLSSYEDRDRGERTAASAPRMLYDPKSGAMVAVQAREETVATGGRKKAAKKNRREKECQKTEPPLSRDSPPEPGKSSRKHKRKDEAASPGAHSPGEISLMTRKKTAVNSSRRLPRTCGVLYARDDNGNCYCADDCEGDLGYGAHSVPGGRTKNPNAYADYIKQKQKKEEASGFDQKYGGSKEEPVSYNLEPADSGIALYTGFNPEEEPAPQQPEPVEYVTADDKLELVTGEDDSPTLKPTAKEFAPSQAALAAAAAAQLSTMSVTSLDTSGELEENFHDAEEEEDDDDGPLGLGFDPTQDMDLVMQSPSHDDTESRLQSVAISALALEPPALTGSADNGPRHIFAFGSSGTWGINQNTTSDNTDWQVPTVVGDKSGVFGAFRGLSGDAGDAASFLSIPTSSSWGSPGLGAVPSVVANGDGPSNPTGD